jgi:glycosyltransferase involved in cell wall biosynthesis
MALLFIFAIVVLINCGFYFLFSLFLFSNTSSKEKTETFPLSLIVCAKNEAQNLKAHIPFWLDQEYPDFEIVLINDASSDNSLEVMETFAKKHSNIKIVDVKNNEAFWGSKKYALTLGIKKAIHERMIFTDADCKPISKKWLFEMSSKFTKEKKLVLGFGSYQKKSGLLNKVIRFETLLTAIQYFSYAKAGIPYMGVGRNLAYTKNLFFDANGFSSHIKIPSGDDDLFVNQVATKKNTAICLSKDSFTYSIPKKTWKHWFHQKKRHLTTAKHYQFKHQLLLSLFAFTQVLFWVLAILSIIFLDWKIPLFLIAFRLIINFLIIGRAASKLNQRDLIFLLPFWELFLIFLQMSIFISNSIIKPTSWK